MVECSEAVNLEVIGTGGAVESILRWVRRILRSKDIYAVPMKRKGELNQQCVMKVCRRFEQLEPDELALNILQHETCHERATESSRGIAEKLW